MSAKRYDGTAVPMPRFKGTLLYLLPLPLVPAFFRFVGDARMGMALATAVAFALFMLAGTLARRGIAIERQALLRKLTRRSSSIPFKNVGGGVLAAATFVTAFIPAGYDLFPSIGYALAAAAGYFIYYGLDPKRDVPEFAAIGVTAEEVLDVIEEAEQKITAIEMARRDIRNMEFKERLRRICTGAREILDFISEEPRDLRRARKFLKVYLDGAQRVTEGYARTHQNADSAELEANFRRVLDTIERVVAEQKQKLLERNVEDLDVQIEVLQLQLEKEGI